MFFDLHSSVDSLNVVAHTDPPFSPIADLNPAAAMKTQVFATLVEEALADTTYDASLAGLDFSVGSDQDGIQVRISGYSQKLPVLLDMVMGKIRNLESDPTTFSSVHDRVSFLITAQCSIAN